MKRIHRGVLARKDREDEERGAPASRRGAPQENSRPGYSRSNSPAAPIPPPMHIDTTPREGPRRFIS